MAAFASLVVAVAGALNAVQSGSDVALVRSLGRPWLVDVLVGLITAAAPMVGLLLTGIRIPEPGQVGTAP